MGDGRCVETARLAVGDDVEDPHVLVSIGGDQVGPSLGSQVVTDLLKEPLGVNEIGVKDRGFNCVGRNAR